MNLKKLGAVLLAVLALGAIAASSASAAEEYVEGTSAWYTGASPGTKLPEGSTKVLKSSAATALVLESTIGSPAVPFKLEASGVECETCTIKNIAGPHAVATGKLKFTGVKLIEPNAAVCTAASPITTKLLQAVKGMKKGSSTVATIKFTPEEGTTFALIEITGATCPISGTYKVTGTAYGEAVNATGVFAKNQQLRFSKTIQQSAQSSTTKLLFGLNEASLTGTANNTLSPEEEWASKEK